MLRRIFVEGKITGEVLTAYLKGEIAASICGKKLGPSQADKWLKTLALLAKNFEHQSKETRADRRGWRFLLSGKDE